MVLHTLSVHDLHITFQLIVTLSLFLSLLNLFARKDTNMFIRYAERTHQ